MLIMSHIVKLYLTTRNTCIELHMAKLLALKHLLLKHKVLIDD